MPSTQHEGLVLLFRNRPALVAQLLRDQLGLALPAYTTATVVAADLSEVTPTERRADLVVMLEGPEGRLAVVVEVQLATDERKRWSWPAYLAELWAREKCAVVLLVVTPDAAVAEWASQPIELGPGSVVIAQVLGPSATPEVLDLAVAQASPELSVLSVMAHGHEANALELAKVAMRSMRGLDDDRAKTYADLVLAALSGAARRALEELMLSGYEYQSDFAKKYVAEGKAESVLDVLRARGLAVDAETEKRVLACSDRKQLQRWLKRALVVDQAADLFAPARAKKTRRR